MPTPPTNVGEDAQPLTVLKIAILSSSGPRREVVETAEGQRTRLKLPGAQQMENLIGKFSL